MCALAHIKHQPFTFLLHPQQARVSLVKSNHNLTGPSVFLPAGAGFLISASLLNNGTKKQTKKQNQKVINRLQALFV